MCQINHIPGVSAERASNAKLRVADKKVEMRSRAAIRVPLAGSIIFSLVSASLVKQIQWKEQVADINLGAVALCWETFSLAARHNSSSDDKLAATIVVIIPRARASFACQPARPPPPTTPERPKVLRQSQAYRSNRVMDKFTLRKVIHA